MSRRPSTELMRQRPRLRLVLTGLLIVFLLIPAAALHAAPGLMISIGGVKREYWVSGECSVGRAKSTPRAATGWVPWLVLAEHWRRWRSGLGHTWPGMPPPLRVAAPAPASRSIFWRARSPVS